MNYKKKEEKPVLHEILIENRDYIVFDAIILIREEGKGNLFFLKMEL